MMKPAKLKVISLFTFGFISLILVFQNCAKQVKFSEASISALSTSSVVEQSVICDPFSAGSNCSAASNSGGLIGDMFYLTSENFHQDLNSARLTNYFNEGYRVEKKIVLSELNFPKRSFINGFPTGIDESGQVTFIKNNQGETLVEYFALRLVGNISVDAEAEGSYEFSLESDDGSSMSIDGKRLIDNDGTHGMVRVESGLFSLKRNIKYPINVNYFQGPRTEIGLIMQWRKCLSLSSGTSCSKFAEWTVVPADVLSH